MALVCSVVLSATSYRAGDTPPPGCTIACYNPGATALTVTGVKLYGYVMGSSTPGRPVVMGNALPPYGPGAPVTVAAGGTQSVGPFPITVGSAAAALRDTNTGNSQPSQPLNYTLMVGAEVKASDLSVATATEAGFLVSYSIGPKKGSQGGLAQFNAGPNAALFFWGF